jgi:glutamate-5-semialdehyde dehydrogenase
VAPDAASGPDLYRARMDPTVDRPASGALQRLEALQPGMPIVVGGDRVTTVSPELAAAFESGDALLVEEATGELLHVPAAARRAASSAVDAAVDAFAQLGSVTDAAIDAFFLGAAERLTDPAVAAAIAGANEADVAAARARGRSTTRLVLSERMLADMVAGLRGWTAVAGTRDEVVARVEHDGWTLEQVRDRLGVVAFVFEGRPNVVADACGVLRGGNAVVFRIGSDALGTADAIMTHVIRPALAAAGLPEGTVSLVASPERAAGWALFSDQRLALAVARGSGRAVEQLGAVARQAGTPVSLHGTGGAWMLVAPSADALRVRATVEASLDRKVCNTLNVCCVVRSRADELVPVVLDALAAAARSRGAEPKLHVLLRGASGAPDVSDLASLERLVGPGWFDTDVEVVRAAGVVRERRAEPIDEAGLATEWEWEDSPELTLAIVDDLDDAMRLCDAHSPRFIVSVLSEDPHDHDRAWRMLEAPFVGDGFTRWVDGQYALSTPELGLSNWQGGRLFGRGGILTGDAIATLRTRVRQHDPGVTR